MKLVLTEKYWLMQNIINVLDTSSDNEAGGSVYAHGELTIISLCKDDVSR